MSETELAKAVIDMIRALGWEIYQEVEFRPGSGIADIVAVFENKFLWIIEVKTSYGLAVLQQASEWQCHYRSVAVPQLKSGHRNYDVANRYFKVGVIHINTRVMTAHETVPAPLHRQFHQNSKYKIDQLTPEHKYFAEAGNPDGKRWTPYQGSIKKIERYLIRHPGSTMKEIIDELGHLHYAHSSSARQSLAGALFSYERDTIRVDRSVRPAKYYLK